MASKKDLDIILLIPASRHPLMNRLILEFGVEQKNENEAENGSSSEDVNDQDYETRILETNSYYYHFLTFPFDKKYFYERIISGLNNEIILWPISIDKGTIELFDFINKQNIRNLKLCHFYGNKYSKVIICLDDMEKVNYSQDTFNSFKSKIITILTQIGYEKIDKIPIIPISSFENDNIKKLSVTNMSWYNGYTLYQALDFKNMDNTNVSVSDIDKFKPFRMSISLVDILEGNYLVLYGFIHQGIIKRGMNIRIYPSGSVHKCTHLGTNNKETAMAKCGDTVIMHIGKWKGINALKPKPGGIVIIDDMKLYPNPPNPDCKRFVALINVDKEYKMKLRINKFVRKMHVSLQQESCKLVSIHWKISNDDNDKKEYNPEFLRGGDYAQVVFEKYDSLIVYPYHEYKQYGMIFSMDLNDYQSIILWGKVIQIMDKQFYKRLILRYIAIYFELKTKINVADDVKLLITQYSGTIQPDLSLKLPFPFPSI